MIELLENEVFVSIKGYEELYEVSNLGRIKSLPRKWYSGSLYNILNDEEERIMNTANSKGYRLIGLTKDNKQTSRRVHRLVAAEFCIRQEGQNEVNHINGIKWDNRAINLEWNTAKQNRVHGIQNGLIKFKRGCEHKLHGKRGELSKISKLILDTETGIFYHGTKEAAAAKNMVQSTLKNRLNGGRKNTGRLIYV